MEREPEKKKKNTNHRKRKPKTTPLSKITVADKKSLNISYVIIILQNQMQNPFNS